jgi:membrane-bound acyltransferase YfiQ involved in biofilm formation
MRVWAVVANDVFFSALGFYLGMKKDAINRLRLAVAWIIVVVWLVSFVLDATVASYNVPASVHGLMAMVAAFLFGPTITGRGGGQGGTGVSDGT